MTRQPQIDTRKDTPDMFSGDVYIDTIVQTVPPTHVRVNSVHFMPGARTAWHSHAIGQYLHVTEGVALVQEHGDEIRLVRSGETIFTAPGVRHWHGATKSAFMTHMAIWEAPTEGTESEWGNHVTNEEYYRQPKF
jgi:quercetin dioxygenase-like cupin family protein